jgi:F1F0 ATPase subunit 2
MTEPLALVFALIAGILLGAFFFGGLWWTVRKGLASGRTALWFFGSMLLRTCVVMLGFYFVMGDSWQRLLAALLGFVLARIVATRLARAEELLSSLAQEMDHAP